MISVQNGSKEASSHFCDTDYTFIGQKITEIIKITDIISIGDKSYECIMHVFKNRAGAFYRRCMN